MDVHISLEGRRDLVGQIYQQVRDAILDGRLKPGEIVPPSRELARRLTVSRNTVGVAYDRLIGDGFIETRRGAGTYVCEHSVASAHPRSRLTSQELRPHPRWDIPYPRWNAVGRPPEGAATVYDFRVGVPDVTLFPFETWRRFMSRELRLSALRTAAYGEAAGHRACAPRSRATSGSPGALKPMRMR